MGIEGSNVCPKRTTVGESRISIALTAFMSIPID
jgi:hypothetical protein